VAKDDPASKNEIVQVMPGSQKVVGAFTEMTENVPRILLKYNTLKPHAIWEYLYCQDEENALPSRPDKALSLTSRLIHPVIET
jgi:hypothetical protein